MNDELIQRRRGDILAASYKVFARKGYHATNISDIAAELKIGHGTFYRYFKNKLDIFSHVLEDVMNRIAETVSREDPAATGSMQEYREQCVRIGQQLLQLFMEDPQLSKMIFYEALGIDEELNARIVAAFDTFAEFTARYLENGVSKGFMRADLAIDETAHAINALVFEGARRVMRSEDRDRAAALWVKATVGLIFDGLGSP